MYKFFSSILFIGFIFWGCASNNDSVLIDSPDGKIQISVKNYNDETKYSVAFDDQIVIEESNLGLIFKNGQKFPNRQKIKMVNNISHSSVWELPWGETRKVKNNYNEAEIVFEDNGNNVTGSLVFRAFNDGIAFRYNIKSVSSSKDSIIITDEITQFRLVEDADLWSTPAYTDNRYEHLYTKSTVSDMDTSHTPITIKYKNGMHLSIHEASLINYSSMQLLSDKNTLICDLAPWANGDKVRTKLPFETPWRTIIIVDKAKDLISSNLTLNCNKPSVIEDASWVKPAKYIGIWWGMIIGKWTWEEGFRHGATNERSVEYIDFASEHGFDEVLIEGWASGWESLFPKDSVTVSFTKSTPDFDIKKIQKYAQSKNISIQAYHETMANTKNYLNQIDSAFFMLNGLGVKNVKIGHVGSKLDKSELHYGQYGVNYFRSVLEKALKYKLGVNFHEPIKDTGERRTFPNMLTREGARGNEYNAWPGGNPPNHTLILPFTRLLNAPMDFTPGIFDVLYKNIDKANLDEHSITITVVDSGNGYDNFRFKSSESIWLEKNMSLTASVDNGKKVNTWTIDENFQIGEWEWGIVADNPSISKFNIWIPQTLGNKDNRRLNVNQNGSLSGQNIINIPFQDLKNKNPDFIRGYKSIDFQRVSTTLAKQLGLYVVIHSPLQMAADFIENYEESPAFQFIKDVPVTWDTTIVVNGEIEEYVTIVRRDRNSLDWYLGAITNESARSFNMSLDFLDEGFYEATIYSDAEHSDWQFNPSSYNISQEIVSKNDMININLVKGGGQAIRFKYKP